MTGKFTRLSILKFTAILTVIFFSQTISAQETVLQIDRLETNKPFGKKIAGGQKHAYKVRIAERQFLDAAVEQIGIDLVIRVIGADGKTLTQFDRNYTTRGTEEVEYSSPYADDLTIEIEPRAKDAPEAAYKITLNEIRAATDDDFALQESGFLMQESRRLGSAGKYKESFAPATRALEIRERILGTENERTALAIALLGTVSRDLGDQKKSEMYYAKALNIFEKINKADTLDAADIINNLATKFQRRGDFAESEKLYLRALEIRERELGSNSNRVASNLNNLGIFYRERGDYAKAQESYERSIAIREQLFGAESVEATFTLNNLAYFYYTKGDYRAALKIHERVLAIREKKLAPDHPYIGETLDNMAVVYADSGEPEKAETLYLRAVENREQKFGKENIRTAPTLSNLAKLYAERGDLVKADSLFRRVLTIAEKNLNRDEIEFAVYLKRIGDFYILKGDYEKAGDFLERALEIRRKVLGTENFEVGRTCSSLARLYLLKAEAARATAFQECANRIDEKNIALNLFIGTEHAKLSYMKLLAEDLDQTINLQISLPDSKPALEQAVTTVLQRKGRVLDAVAGSLTDLRRRFDAKDQILLQKLNDTLAALAELSLNKPENISPEDYQKQIGDLEEQKSGIEDEISRRSKGIFELPKPVTLAKMRNEIPQNSALVEFSLYRTPDKKSGSTAKGESRYIAFVIRNQGETHSVKLGSAAEIDAAVDIYRKALRDQNSRNFQAAANVIYQKLMKPIQPFLTDTTQLLISPDGNLNLIPFEALTNEKNQYLIEQYAFTYLSGGRDLLRLKTPREYKDTSLIVANPSFGESRRKENPPGSAARSEVKRSVTAARNLSETYFAPLAATTAEARSIQALFPNAVLLTGAQANESALKQAIAPRILHIATHGFFLENAGESETSKNSQNRRANAETETENPLLRSGIALAGANKNKNRDAKDDGILTALEASGLNLWGTKLVVLSACDTGLGDVKNGEGVYGLRRAFMLAGTESLVMSLWAVSDYATRELMTDYYKNLKNGTGRGEALRQIKLAMLKKKGREHPFYWAAFIQSGEWANLEGKR